MTGWSDWPLGRVLDHAAVDGQEKMISSGGGESKIIYEVGGMPGWLVKLYKPGMAVADARLDRLISVPAGLRPAEVRLVDTAISWPVSRVVDQGRTVGVVIPKAPAGFVGQVRRPDGKLTEPTMITVDLLCQSDSELRAKGLRVPSGSERRAACRRLAEVGALFERSDLVYGDWSYQNAFWNPAGGSIYIIDLDSCGFGSRPWVGTINWEDPKVVAGQRIDGSTDRYRLGLLVARCLSGVRNPDAVRAALRGMRGREPAADVLNRMIDHTLPAVSRPEIKALVAALTDGTGTRIVRPVVPPLDAPAGANVESWRSVGPRPAPEPARRGPAAPPPSWPAPPSRPPTRPGQPSRPRPSVPPPSRRAPPARRGTPEPARRQGDATLTDIAISCGALLLAAAVLALFIFGLVLLAG